MSKAWTVPTGDDLWQVVSRQVVEKTDEDVEGGKAESNDFEGTLDTRAKEAVAHAVAEVRGAIETAGRYAVSATADSVPPEGVQHTLALAAWRLAMVKPTLMALILSDGGMFSPLNQLCKDAKDWIKCLKKGDGFTEPTDPTGVDYQTAVSATNPAISGIRWGCSLGDDNEFSAGVTEDGVVISRLSENMNTQ